MMTRIHKNMIRKSYKKMRIFYLNTTKKKSSRFIIEVPRYSVLCELKKIIVFCNFLGIKTETKKVVRLKVVPNWVFYSCVKYGRLNLGDPVYVKSLILIF